MTYHIAICNDDSRDAGYVSELLHLSLIHI